MPSSLETQANAMIEALQKQRNAAMDDLVNLWVRGVE